MIVLTFASPGWAAPPDINVQGNGINIPNDPLPHQNSPDPANGTDFGSQIVGTDTDQPFTIENTGNNSTLTIGTVTVDDTNNFEVLTQPASSITDDQTTNFTIRFHPDSQGVKTATVTIPNNDPNGGEAPYYFAIQGTGSGTPDINVYYATPNDIPPNSTTPSIANGTDFDNVGVGSFQNRTFTIWNEGNADLNLTGLQPDYVVITGPQASDFTVTAQPNTPVGAGLTETFTVQFSPQAGGLHEATVTIPNNDPDTGTESPYTFSVQGTGQVAAPTVTLDTPPSVANVEDTTAELKGVITSTGGEDASDRGIWWSLTQGFTPGAPFSYQVSTGGSWGPGPFTQNVTGLNAGSLIYFQAFATNSAGTGFSAEQPFQTEPDLQPITLQFSNVTFDSMTISWTPRSGDGSIVVMKESGAVDSDPLDFTEHSFNSSFGSGAELGTGNFVVYRGSAMSVDVTNLPSLKVMHVAIYSYAGSGETDPDGINYQQASPNPLTGSQSTPAGPPSLSTSSIIGFHDAISGATLQHNITGDGGGTISERGTVWDLFANPDEQKDKEVEGGTATGIFNHTVTTFPSGKRIYFRGYALNGSGYGFSPSDGIFYTEPGIQASNIQFSNVTYNSFTIDWTSSNDGDAYDGSIVVVKLTDPVDTDPADGTAHTADSFFGSGAELGTGNFVVYRGSATSVNVTGLWHERTYHVAVYEYSGSGSDINYQQANPDPLTGSQLTPTAPSHREAYNIECGECHAHNGFGNFVSRDTDQENLCKTCHIAGGQAAAKKDVALHSGGGATTDCGSCHELHNSNTADVLVTTDWRTSITNDNRDWVRGNIDKYVTGATVSTPVIYHNATYASGEFARPASDGNSSPNGLLDGLCQACHTNPGGNTTKYHTNDPNNVNGNAPMGPNEYTHPTERGDYTPGDTCLACHPHSGGFAPVVTETNCLASGCHDQVQGTRRQIVGTGGDFNYADMTSYHVNDGLGGEIVTRWDCVVCHAEGDAVTGAITSYHINASGATVDLRHADGTITSNTDANAVYTDWPNLTPQARSEFCLSCHDIDGADIITSRTDPDPDATTNALNPFNDEVTNMHEPAGLDATPAPHERLRAPYVYPNDLGVVDVASQFDYTNASNHALTAEGPAYSSAAPFGNAVDSAIQGVRTDLAWNSTLDCEDCHVTTDRLGYPVGLAGHGSLNARYMLVDKDGNDTAATGANGVCYRCHNPSDTNSVFPDHDQGQHLLDSSNLFGIGCLNCHGGGIVGGTQWGAVHGVSALDIVTDDSSLATYIPYVFTYGSGIDLMSNWVGTQGQTVTCSTSEKRYDDVDLLNNCTNHSSKDWNRAFGRSYAGP
jgi:hypothetical protein